MKVYKQITRDNGTITFYGGHWRKLYWACPDWENDKDNPHQYFIHNGRRVYLDDFMRIDKTAPDYMQEFDGYSNDSFFSGLCVTLPKPDDGDHDEMVRVFTYIA